MANKQDYDKVCSIEQKVKFFKRESKGFGDATIVRNTTTKEHYLIKEKVFNNEKEFEFEIKKTKNRPTINHKNMLRFHDYSTISKIDKASKHLKIRLFYDYWENSLESEVLMRRTHGNDFSIEEITYLFYDMITVCAFLESKEVNHGGICPSVILINNQHRFLLGDRLSQKASYPQNQIDKFIRNEKLYIAPEVFKYIKNKDSRALENANRFKSDVFTLGMVFLEIGVMSDVTGIYNRRLDEVDRTTLQKYMNLFENRYINNPFICSVLRKMLEIDDYKRPTFNDLIYALPELAIVKQYFEDSYSGPNDRRGNRSKTQIEEKKGLSRYDSIVKNINENKSGSDLGLKKNHSTNVLKKKSSKGSNFGYNIFTEGNTEDNSRNKKEEQKRQNNIASERGLNFNFNNQQGRNNYPEQPGVQSSHNINFGGNFNRNNPQQGSQRMDNRQNNQFQQHSRQPLNNQRPNAPSPYVQFPNKQQRSNSKNKQSNNILQFNMSSKNINQGQNRQSPNKGRKMTQKIPQNNHFNIPNNSNLFSSQVINQDPNSRNTQTRTPPPMFNRPQAHYQQKQNPLTKFSYNQQRQPRISKSSEPHPDQHSMKGSQFNQIQSFAQFAQSQRNNPQMNLNYGTNNPNKGTTGQYKVSGYSNRFMSPRGGVPGIGSRKNTFANSFMGKKNPPMRPPIGKFAKKGSPNVNRDGGKKGYKIFE